MFFDKASACENGSIPACDEALAFVNIGASQRDLVLRQRERNLAREAEQRQQEEHQRRAREQEERRLSEVSALKTAMDECRRYSLHACETALSSPIVTDPQRQNIASWRAIAIQFETDRAACRSGAISGCEAALSSPAATEENRRVISTWRDAAQRFEADRTKCRDGFISACDAALIFPGATLLDREQLGKWRSDSLLLNRFLRLASKAAAALLAIFLSAFDLIATLPLSTKITGSLAAVLALILLRITSRRIAELYLKRLPPSGLVLKGTTVALFLLLLGAGAAFWRSKSGTDQLVQAPGNLLKAEDSSKATSAPPPTPTPPTAQRQTTPVRQNIYGRWYSKVTQNVLEFRQDGRFVNYGKERSTEGSWLVVQENRLRIAESGGFSSRSPEVCGFRFAGDHLDLSDCRLAESYTRVYFDRTSPLIGKWFNPSNRAVIEFTFDGYFKIHDSNPMILPGEWMLVEPGKVRLSVVGGFVTPPDFCDYTVQGDVLHFSSCSLAAEWTRVR
jgi:hypothetical protein